jgi:hypothetical protein
MLEMVITVIQVQPIAVFETIQKNIWLSGMYGECSTPLNESVSCMGKNLTKPNTILT